MQAITEGCHRISAFLNFHRRMDMNDFTKLALASCLLAGACAPSGQYDSNGTYHAYGNSDSYRNEHAMANDAPADYYSAVPAGTTTVVYSRPGYYDYNGYYITGDNGPSVPHNLLPPRGLCRVWFTDRPEDRQPPVESCQGIQSRVPVGAYVIYGG
jgi:hypothetical protein